MRNDTAKLDLAPREEQTEDAGGKVGEAAAAHKAPRRYRAKFQQELHAGRNGRKRRILSGRSGLKFLQ